MKSKRTTRQQLFAVANQIETLDRLLSALDQAVTVHVRIQPFNVGYDVILHADIVREAIVIQKGRALNTQQLLLDRLGEKTRVTGYMDKRRRNGNNN